MNNEFCNIVKIYLKNEIQGIRDGKIILKPEKTPISANAADFDILPTTSETKAGILSEVSLTLYIGKLSKIDAETLAIRRSVIIEVPTSGGDKVIIGSLDYPARAVIEQHINTDKLIIHHKQPRPHTI